MEIGSKFADYADFVAKLREYEKENFMRLWIRNSTTVARALKLNEKRNIPETMKYSHMRLECVHSGKHVSKSTGSRPQQKTNKGGCSYRIHWVFFSRETKTSHSGLRTVLCIRKRIHDPSRLPNSQSKRKGQSTSTL